MMMEFESSVAGLSDGGAHCGLICDASMPTGTLLTTQEIGLRVKKYHLSF